MRILAFDETGVQAADRSLWRRLNERGGCTIHLAVPGRWKELGMVHRAEPESTGLDVRTCTVLLAGRSHRAYWTGLVRLWREIQPDCVYVNAEPESVLAWQAAIAKRRFFPGTRLVFMSWRNLRYPPGVYPYRAPFLNAAAERAVLRAADLCIARNETARRIFAERGFREVVLLPPAVDTDLFVPPDPPTQRGAFVIGYAGRLVREKNLDLLLEAVAGLPADTRCVLAGAGPDRSRLEGIARRSELGGRVEFPGPVPRSFMPCLLGALDVFVLPSRTGVLWKEQFGRVLVEAMACGVPVVGSDSGEIPAVIGEAGYIFPEGDSRELRTCLQILHGSAAERERLRELGLRRSRGCYSVGVLAPAYGEVFGCGVPPGTPPAPAIDC
ncbi:MAG: glycosyltransferase [Bacteroidota bacterium]